jgi:hypothetical protein
MVDAPETRTHLPVSVLIRVTPTPEHRWLDERLETLAVLPAADGLPASEHATDSSSGERIIRHDGLSIELHADEAESYYFNLMVDEPRCFVAYQGEEGERPLPFVVTPSFDLAASYEEGDLRVDAVALDPALLQPIESFVLLHYVPEKKIKRKRRNWSKS